MSTYYVPIEKAPLIYIDDNGEFKKLTVKPIKGVNIPNSFDIPYVRGAVGLFNAIISRMMYFATYDGSHRERQFQKAQEYIYLPAYQISGMINRCESQSYNIIRSLERILGIHVRRAHEQHGANMFRLSQRVYEFLHIFTPGKLNEFIDKYNIHPEDQYALRQLYNYRVVRPTDANMDRVEREEFHSFIKSRRHRNFLHYCSQNNVTPQSRVAEIELHIDLLSPIQLEQLQQIKSFLAEGITKLANYFHWKLIDLQQFVTMMLEKAKTKASKSNRETNTQPSLGSNRNKTEGEQQKTEEVAAVHLKDPENPSIQEVVHVATYWNIMASGRDMEFMTTLTNKNIQSIQTLVKSHGKDTVLTAIENTSHLYQSDNRYPVILFKDFIKDSTNPESRFNKVLRHTHIDTRFSQREMMIMKEKTYKFKLNDSPVSYDNIPGFTSMEEAKSWFKSHSNQM